MGAVHRVGCQELAFPLGVRGKVLEVFEYRIHRSPFAFLFSRHNVVVYRVASHRILGHSPIQRRRPEWGGAIAERLTDYAICSRSFEAHPA